MTSHFSQRGVGLIPNPLLRGYTTEVTARSTALPFQYRAFSWFLILNLESNQYDELETYSARRQNWFSLSLSSSFKYPLITVGFLCPCIKTTTAYWKKQ